MHLIHCSGLFMQSKTPPSNCLSLVSPVNTIDSITHAAHPKPAFANAINHIPTHNASHHRVPLRSSGKVNLVGGVESTIGSLFASASILTLC